MKSEMFTRILHCGVPAVRVPYDFINLSNDEVERRIFERTGKTLEQMQCIGWVVIWRDEVGEHRCKRRVFRRRVNR